MKRTDTNILSIRNLKTYFYTEEGVIKAVDDISFDLSAGKTLGIVGESGSGKSVASLSIMQLIASPPGKIVSGEILFQGKDLLKLSPQEMRAMRGKRIAMIFQDPMTSLNPFMRIGEQLMEMTRLHQGLTKKAAYQKALEALETVGIPDATQRINHYPHQFSGGMRQRVVIAMAISCNPELLIADEATTALDVTIQAQILALIKTLKEKMGTSIILITHDLSVMAGMTDNMAVMYAGKIVEYGHTTEIFSHPHHPYTQGLLKSVPDPNIEQEILFQIPGQPPDLAHLPPGCPFAPRCSHKMDKCQEMPPIQHINADHYSACWLEG